MGAGLRRAKAATRLSQGKGVPYDQIIADYLAAYEAANGIPFHAKIIYLDGWFRWADPFQRRRRSATMIGNTKRLKARAVQPGGM